MLRSALRSLFAHKLRLALTVASIVLGVSFVAGTFVFTDSLQRSFDQLFAQPQADVVVAARSDDQGLGTDPAAIPQALVGEVAAVPGVSVAEGYISVNGAVVLGRDGKPLGGASGQSPGRSWLQDATLNPYAIVAGRAPKGPAEVVVDVATADKASIDVGASLRIVTPVGSDATRSWTVVGIAQRGISGSLGAASTVLFDLPTAQAVMLGKPQVSEVRVLAEPGVSQAELAGRVDAAITAPITVRTGQQISDDTSRRLQEALGFLTTFLLAFAFIALFVAGFLITNTFSMLIAQRTRELALTRAIGASRWQVQGSVLVEAGVVGAVASTLGLAAGLGLSQLLRLLFAAFGAELPGGSLVVAPRTILITYAIGLVVTMLAASLPARRAARVPPVAALRDDPGMAASRSLVRRGLLGVALLAGAIGLGAVALQQGEDAEAGARWVGASAFVGLLAAITLAPLLARPLLGLLGSAFPTTVGRLARENGRRNPRRTAATASALTIGVALMSALGVIAASATASVDKVIDDTIGADFVVLGVGFRPFPPAVAAAVADTPGTSVVTAVRQTFTRTQDGDRTIVTGADPDALAQVINLTFTQGSLSDLGLGNAVTDTDTATANGYRVGQTLKLAFPNGPGSLRLVGLYEPAGLYQGFIVDKPTIASLGSLEQDSAIYVRLMPNADPAAVRADLDQRLTAFPTVQVQDQRQFKDDIRSQVTRVLGFLFALLALGVLIAFLGIVNTLLLSVVERTREIGLLRAVGASRSQVRWMIVIEALLLGIFGALLGVGLGVAYGVLLQQVLAPQGISQLAIPGGQLAAFVALGAVGAVLAAGWPAIRAARLDVLRAIATE